MPGALGAGEKWEHLREFCSAFREDSMPHPLVVASDSSQGYNGHAWSAKEGSYQLVQGEYYFCPYLYFFKDLNDLMQFH